MRRRSEISLASRPVLSHSADAVAADELLFVAGILPVDADGALVGGDDVSRQARSVFSDLGEILASGGCSGEDVARITVYLTSIADAAMVDEPLRKTCGASSVAGTVVEVSGLAIPGARIEIDAIAVRAS